MNVKCEHPLSYQPGWCNVHLIDKTEDWKAVHIKIKFEFALEEHKTFMMPPKMSSKHYYHHSYINSVISLFTIKI